MYKYIRNKIQNIKFSLKNLLLNFLNWAGVSVFADLNTGPPIVSYNIQSINLVSYLKIKILFSFSAFLIDNFDHFIVHDQTVDSNRASI